MADSKKITPIDWTADILAKLYDPSLSPFGALASAHEIFGGCHLYVYEDGEQRAYVAARPVKLQGGIRLDLIGVKSTGSKMCGAGFEAAVAEIAALHNAQWIALMTKIPKIAEKCIANGYTITGAVLTKKMELADHG